MEPTRTDEKQFAPNPEVKLHFLDYWRIIRIRKTVILAVFLLVSLTTTIVTFILPESFSSFVRISILREASDVEGLRDRGFGSALVYDPYALQTEFQRIQSRPVLEKVVERLNLQEEWARKFKSPTAMSKDVAYRRLKGHISVQQSHSSTLVEIHAFSDNKDEAAKLANAIAETYAQHRAEKSRTATEGGIVELRKDLAKRDTTISNQMQRVNSLRHSLGISDYEAAGDAPTPSLDQETLRKYDSMKVEAERTVAQATNLFANLKALTRDELKKAAPVAVPDPELNDLISKENAADQQLARLSATYGPEYSEVKSINETLKTVRRQVDARLEGMLTGVRLKVDSARSDLETFQRILDNARSKDADNYAKTRPYYEAKEQLRQMKFNRERLAMKIEEQDLEMRLPKDRSVEVIEPAVPIDKAVRPNKTLNIALGVVVGLIIGIGLAFFIEYLDTSVKTIDDVERSLQAPVLGVIPQNVGLLIDEGPESPHGEAYRVLRTNVLFSRKDPKLNTLTVVSGGAGEGKSTTIFNLATVFAQNGQRVLVVDSDLRRPSLHKFLKVSNSVGLTDFLMKRNTLEEVIQTSSLPSMDFLPSGKLPSSSLGILSSVQMKELIRDVKRRYDFVFFDSPPIMGVSDASILASEVDMVLQVIQYRRYPQPMTIRAKQMIEKVGGNLLGIVLNNINMSQDENYYYYSGYYYDYYTKGEYASAEKQAAKPDGSGGAAAKVEIKSKF
jgi:capsular exopolysaccharide synthesis family protein